MVHFIVADAEDSDLAHRIIESPFSQPSENPSFPPLFDLVVSNATFQWFNEPAKTLQNLSGLIKPNRWMLFSTFGVQTLTELHQSMIMASSKNRIPYRRKGLTYADGDLWVNWCKKAGFDEITLEESMLRQHFAGVKDFQYSIRRTGTSDASTGPLQYQRRTLLDMQFIYEKHFRDEQGVYCTYHPMFVSGRKKFKSFN
ncbi:methyltransferase domain-containing protein [Heliobacillus mobilis]|uniref:Methyltransferase domain-containing protein n=1 Tax=Heliobacterium mobile TaxID=28064 RepID=A0A6I3SCN9_HELMO|nr:methyltransferase domain-containing protein [Heliobacterium mobile]MTV47849.1 methyltransferase domain-containing protein [Heliobacterium mobile]